MFPFSDNVPRRSVPIVTYGLILLNVCMFMYSLRLPVELRDILVIKHGFIPARLAQQLFSAEPRALIVELDKPVRIVDPHTGRFRVFDAVPLPANRIDVLLSMLTSIFLHGGWLHLVGNMWMLWLFGDNVEDQLGHVRYLFFYLMGGLLATLCHWSNDPASGIPVIGASGSIAAVMGAYAITWPTARVKTFVFIIFFVTIVELPAALFHGVWFLSQLLQAREMAISSEGGGVAWWAHIGGFIAGMIMMWQLNDEDAPAVPPRFREFD